MVRELVKTVPWSDVEETFFERIKEAAMLGQSLSGLRHAAKDLRARDMLTEPVPQVVAVLGEDHPLGDVADLLDDASRLVESYTRLRRILGVRKLRAVLEAIFEWEPYHDLRPWREEAKPRCGSALRLVGEAG